MDASHSVEIHHFGVDNSMPEEKFISFSCGTNHTGLLPIRWSHVFESNLDVLCNTNKHWLEFEPPPWSAHLLLLSAYLIVMIIGCVGNGAVIYLFMSTRILRTPSNLFILNLAISDFIILFILVILSQNVAKEKPMMERLGCEMYGFLGAISGTSSIMTLAAISLDRYLVIAFPLDPLKKLNHRQVSLIILGIWLYSGIFSAVPLLGIEGIAYQPEGYLTSCSFDYLSDSSRTKAFIGCFFVAAWVVPLIMITFSYSVIVHTVSQQDLTYKSSKITNQGTRISFRSPRKSMHMTQTRPLSVSSIKHQHQGKKRNSELKLARVACCIVSLWFLAWTPYAIVSLIGISGRKDLITPLTSMIPALFCKTAACIDPYIYALSHPRCKKEIHKKFRRHCNRRFYLMLFCFKRNVKTGPQFQCTDSDYFLMESQSMRPPSTYLLQGIGVKPWYELTAPADLLSSGQFKHQPHITSLTVRGNKILSPVSDKKSSDSRPCFSSTSLGISHIFWEERELPAEDVMKGQKYPKEIAVCLSQQNQAAQIHSTNKIYSEDDTNQSKSGRSLRQTHSHSSHTSTCVSSSSFFNDEIRSLKICPSKNYSNSSMNFHENFSSRIQSCVSHKKSLMKPKSSKRQLTECNRKSDHNGHNALLSKVKSNSLPDIHVL